MATHDYVIDNSTGANVRADINNVLQAILTNNSSSSAPSTTAAYMWWADTTSGTLKIRNSANNDWVELLQLDGTLTLENGTVSAPALAFRDDLDTGIFSSADNVFDIATGGVARLQLDSVETTFNEDGADVNFRIEGDTEANLFYLDAGENRIGIGTASPGAILHLSKDTPVLRFTDSSTSRDAQIVCIDGSFRFDADNNNAQASTNIAFRIDGTERMRISSSGRLMVGSTSVTAVPIATTARNPQAEIVGSLSGSNHHGSLSIRCTNDSANLYLGSALTSGTRTAGSVVFLLNDGTDYHAGARIDCANDDTTANNDTPGRLVFSTTADGASSPTERMRIDSSGRLLIGTTTQSSTNLTVFGDGTNDNKPAVLFQNSLTGTGSSNGFYVGGDHATTDGYVWNYEGSNVIFATNSSERMRIDSSGKVGIGTSSPSTNLHVHTDANGEGILVKSTGNTSNALTFDANRGAGGGIGNVYGRWNGTTVAQISFISGADGTNKDDGVLTFGTESAASSGNVNATERMRIDSSGNVGIGTSSPDTMLHLESNGVSTIRLTDNDTTAENDQMIGKIEFETRDSNATGIGADILTEITDTTSSACALFLRTGTPSTLGTRLMVHSGGKLTATGVYNGITTGGSPVYVESDGDLLRFTSSSKYKTDIETLEDTRADNILNCRPVWYKSTCANDIKTEGGTKSDWGWYGFIAEEVATVDPRLVSWATKDSVETEGSANNKSVERDPSKYTAEGVRYDNFVPLLVNLLKRQKSQIEVLETKVAALEAA
jgi:ribosomal protein L27